MGEMEDWGGNETGWQPPKSSEISLENPFYSQSFLPVVSLKGKLTSLHGSLEHPGVHFKAGKSKLEMSLFSG